MCVDELKDEVEVTTESRGGDGQWERCVLPFLTPQILVSHLRPVFNSPAGESWDYGGRWECDGGKGEEERSKGCKPSVRVNGH